MLLNHSITQNLVEYENKLDIIYKKYIKKLNFLHFLNIHRYKYFIIISTYYLYYYFYFQYLYFYVKIIPIFIFIHFQ